MTLFDFITPSHIVEFFLILARVGGVFVAGPLLSNRAVPRMVKLVIIIMVSLLLAPIVHANKPVAAVTEVQLILMVVTELTIGVVIGFAASTMFLAIQAAGELFGTQVGYNIASIIDPANEGSSGVLATFYVMMGALLFLYLNGHHVMLSALGKSFQIIPLNEGINLMFGKSLTDLVAYLFMMAIQLSAPIIVVLTILQLIFGLVTKLSPQLNIYMNAGLILGPMVGMVILMVTLPLFQVLMTQMTEKMEPQLLIVIKSMKGI